MFGITQTVLSSNQGYTFVTYETANGPSPNGSFLVRGFLLQNGGNILAPTYNAQYSWFAIGH